MKLNIMMHGLINIQYAYMDVSHYYDSSGNVHSGLLLTQSLDLDLLLFHRNEWYHIRHTASMV